MTNHSNLNRNGWDIQDGLVATHDHSGLAVHLVRTARGWSAQARNEREVFPELRTIHGHDIASRMLLRLKREARDILLELRCLRAFGDMSSRI